MFAVDGKVVADVIGFDTDLDVLVSVGMEALGEVRDIEYFNLRTSLHRICKFAVDHLRGLIRLESLFSVCFCSIFLFFARILSFQ